MNAPNNTQASVVDVCCGSRMFWFDRKDPRAIFADKRRETHVLPDVSSAGGSRTLEVNPDVIADFTSLPWPDNRFALVVFDPPHLVRAGRKGWQAKKYGTLEGDWHQRRRNAGVKMKQKLLPGVQCSDLLAVNYGHTNLSALEKANAQIKLYAPCACGSGKKFKFCCKR